VSESFERKEIPMMTGSLKLLLASATIGACGTAALAAIATRHRLSPDLPWRA
jgi:hypothetical protein